MEEYYKLKTLPQCNPNNVVQGKNYRFTVLTPQLIRLEYCPENQFKDHATQVVLNRNFPKVSFRMVEKENALEIITKDLHLCYNKKPFSKNGLSIEVLGNYSNYQNIWKYSDKLNDLLGTARTLDNTAGSIPLEHGLLSVYGFSVLDDSGSLTLLDDGWVAPRKKKEIDLALSEGKCTVFRRYARHGLALSRCRTRKRKWLNRLYMEPEAFPGS